MHMKNNSKWLAAALSVVAVLLINWVSGLEFFRIDLTEGKVYTLSDGTKQILKNLDEPVTLRFYVSQGDDNMPLPLKGYARRVEDLLREFKAASKGKLVIEKLDPQPDSDAEDTASLDGVQPQSLNTGERFYFGLVVKRGEQKSAIPSIVMQRERLLEYDIVRAITRTAITKKTKIGVLSSIPVFGSPGMPMMGMPPSPKQVFISELERDFEVVRVSGSSTKIDDEVKVLLVIHPKGLSESTEFAIDQFILRGGKVIALLDSYAYFDLIPTPQGMQPGGSSSNLERLTKAWGVTFETEKMLADLQFMTGKGNRALPTLLTLNETAYSPTDIATAQLGEVLLAFTGAFTSSLTPGLKQVDLIKSSGYSELVSKEIAMEKGEQLGTMIKPSGQSYPIAIRLEGQFKTAFPDGMPKSAANESASKSPLVKADASKGPASKEVDVAVPVSEVLTQSKENNAVILIADSDNVAVQIQEVFGQRIVYPTNGNLAFLQSLVDQFAGDAALVSLRARQSTSYPFTVIREMETRAQQAYVGKIKALEENLQKTRESLAEIQKNKSPADSGAILNAEQLAQVENFKKTAAQTSQELKSLRKDLRADSEALQFWAKVLNIALIPLLVFLTGLGFYFWGSRRAR